MSWKKYVSRKRRDADFERELEAHLAHETDGYIDAGLSPDAARHAALRKIGNVTSLRETIHEGNSLAWLEGCLRDLRYAMRQLRLSPGFAAVAILSLAMGAGLNTAIFQLLDAVRLRSLPVAHPDSLVELSIAKPRSRTGNFTGFPSEFTNAMWEQIRDRQTAFSGALAWSMDRINLSSSGEARFAQGMWVSGDFFRTLGVEPVLGRAFAAAEDNRQCDTGAVIGYAFWQREFGGDPAVLARSVTVNTVRFPILGVAPESFFGIEAGRRFDVALPLCAERIADGGEGRIDKDTDYWLGIMGRLRRGWRLEKAQAQLRAIGPRIFAATLPSRYDAEAARKYLALRIAAEPAATGESEMRGEHDPLFYLLAASTMVLLIACANLASITLARASAREREIAVRLAIGASRGRIVRQLLAESLIVSILGCGAGLIVGVIFSRALARFLGEEVFLDLSLDWRVALFTAGIAVTVCVMFGLAPALRSTRMARALAQTAGGRIAGASREGIAARRILAVAQMALSLVLVAAALLCIGGLRTLLTLDPGFRADGVAIVMADVSGANIPAAQRAPYYFQMLERIRASKGVAAAAAVQVIPIGGGTWSTPVAVGSDGSGERVETETYMNEATPGYFRAMRIPLLAGRDFAGSDDIHSRKVAIIDRTFVETFFHGANPVGKVFRCTGSFGGGEYEIVGVCADSKYSSLREGRHSTAYLDAAQDPNWDTETAFVVRANGPVSSAAEAVRQAAHDMEPRPQLFIRTLTQIVDNSLQQGKLLAALSGLYGALAALLAAIGVYGALSYSVARRKNEIGVRMALGASRGAVVAMVLRETSALAVVGVAIGGGMAIAVTRIVASQVFGIQALSAPAVAAASVGLALLALAASFVPARRAAGIDPAATLREE